MSNSPKTLEEREARARTAIVDALNTYLGDKGSVSTPNVKGIINSSEIHSKLTYKNVDDGILAFALLNKMTGGSVGDVDLYRLLQAYLLNPEKRTQINKVLTEK